MEKFRNLFLNNTFANESLSYYDKNGIRTFYSSSSYYYLARNR